MILFESNKMDLSGKELSYTVSAVIPAYNAERHVGRAIESVLAQERPATEIIVVDDGSTDATEQVVRGYGDQVRYIRQENAGASVARNRGIEAAGGGWIAFLDADDEWLPEKLKVQAAYLERHPALAWAYSNFHQEIRPDSPLKLTHQADKAAALLGDKGYFDSYFAAYTGGIFAWTGTLIIRRRALLEAGLFRVGQLRAQDTDMWFRLAYRWPEVGYVSEPLAIYHRLAPQSITKIHVDSQIIGDLVERHLGLSAEQGKLAEFRPCGISMLQVWLRELVGQRRHKEILELTDRFAEMFSWRFRSEMRLRARHPYMAPGCIFTVGLIKKLWGAFKFNRDNK